jgi:hypothetical protein
MGEVIAGPAEGEDILIADCSVERIFRAKSYCDVAGHYSRPDVFQLRVNTTSHCRVVEMQGKDTKLLNGSLLGKIIRRNDGYWFNALAGAAWRG